MKKFLVTLLCAIVFFTNTLPVDAATIIPNKNAADIPVTTTSDISVYSGFTPSNMVFNTYNVGSQEMMNKFVMDKDGIVMFKVTNYNVNLMTINGTTTTTASAPITISIYMDSAKRNKVTEFQSIQSDYYVGPMYLEKGTYYTFIKSPTTTQTTGASSSFITGTFQCGILAQYGSSTETIPVSSFNVPNTLYSGVQSFKTFVTDIAREDWWKFTVTQGAQYDFKFYRFSGKGNVNTTILNSNKVSLAQTSIPDSYSESFLSIYLEAGTYYIQYASADNTSNIGGDITCEFEYNVYEMEPSVSTTKKTKDDVTITLNANFPVAQSCLIKQKKVKNITESNKASDAVWNKAMFTGMDEINVSENGYYWLLARDANKNVIYQKIKIANIDKKAPSTPIISSCKKGKKYVSGTGEKGSTAYVVITWTQDGTQYKKTYKATVDKETGKFKVKTRKLKYGYICEIYLKDKAGNQSESVRITLNAPSTGGGLYN